MSPNSDKRDLVSEIVERLLVAAIDKSPEFCEISIQRQAGKVVNFKIIESVNLK